MPPKKTKFASNSSESKPNTCNAKREENLKSVSNNNKVDYSGKSNADNVPVPSKKNKTEAPETRSDPKEKTFHGIFSYESLDTELHAEQGIPSFNNCTLLCDVDKNAFKGKKYPSIQMTLNLYCWDDEIEELDEVIIDKWEFRE